jgi:3-dehydroquinate synthase
MQKFDCTFSSATVEYFFDYSVEYLFAQYSERKIILLTDANVFAAHPSIFLNRPTIVIEAGEQHKNQATVDKIIEELLRLETDRNTLLVGIGGGVVTDIAGYVAGIYMRGIDVGFVPTTILAMVDASIGGKNGIDVGVYKNMIGLIRQPKFLCYDLALLQTLPNAEWINGFAEIIKHACIKSEPMFRHLVAQQLSDFQNNHQLLSDLILQNAQIKNVVVQNDEFEKGDRKLLNFGHTLGHAIENELQLPHGHAISVGMMVASRLSAKQNGFAGVADIEKVLKQYGLTVAANYDKIKAMEVLRMDKKRIGDKINFILLSYIGEAYIEPISFEHIEQAI